MNVKTKICYMCRKKYLATIEFFYKRSDSKDGLRNECKKCQDKRNKKYREKNKEKMREQQKKYYRKNPKRFKNSRIKYEFGITLKEYNQMLEEQDGRCGICRIHYSKLKKFLCIDHDHKTSKIRDLLCDHCNFMLGFIEKYKKDPNKWDNYLKKHKKEE